MDQPVPERRVCGWCSVTMYIYEINCTRTWTKLMLWKKLNVSKINYTYFCPQAKFQQKQMQERGMKIASLYEAQQTRALDKVRLSPSSNGHVANGHVVGSPPQPPVQAVPHQPGKVTLCIFRFYLFRRHWQHWSSCKRFLPCTKTQMSNTENLSKWRRLVDLSSVNANIC